MKCYKCNNIIDLDKLSCSICGAPLYWFELSSPFLYQSDEAKLSARLVNKGPEPYQLDALMLGDQELGDSKIEVDSHQSRNQAFDLPGEIAFGSYQVRVKILFRGRPEILPLAPIGPGEVKILEWPVFEVPDRLEVKPSNEYKAALTIKLKNAHRTLCSIQAARLIPEDDLPLRYSVFDHQSRILSNGSLGLSLGNVQEGPNASTVDQITLIMGFDPGLSPGKRKVRLRLEDGSLPLLETDLELIIFTLPAIKLAKGEWGREMFDYQSLERMHRLIWRAPANLKISKRVRLISDPGNQPLDLMDLPVEVKLDSPVAEFCSPTLKFHNEAYVDLTLHELSSSDWEALPSQGGEMRVQESRLAINTFSGRDEYILQLNRFKPEDAQYNLSLDFGTTGSCVAIARPNDKGLVPNPGTLNTVAINFATPSYLLPSRVDRSGANVLVGSDAPIYPNFEPIKPRMFRLLGKEQEQCFADARLLMQTCLERAVGWLVDQPQVKEILFRRIVLAVPTSFPLLWKENLREICREAGEEVFGDPQISLVEESMAAVRYYILRNPDAKNIIMDKDLIVVVDFGGGSSDITFLQRQQDNHYTFKPILHGGMRDFAGFRLDLLIKDWLQQEHLVDEVDVISTEFLKRSLGDEEKFYSKLEAIGITEINKKRRALKGIKAMIKNTVEERFQKCFQPLLSRAKQNLSSDTSSPRVLLLLAGNCSMLHGFPDNIQAAWIRAVTEEVDNGWGAPSVVRMQEPKRCVALGGFLTYVVQHGESPLHNSVPEDLLLGVSDRFSSQAGEQVLDFKHGLHYLVLFEAGAELDENHQIQRVISASRLGFVPGDPSCRDLVLYSCFPGEEPEMYDTIPCEPNPGQQIIDELVFTYNPGGPGKLISIKPLP